MKLTKICTLLIAIVIFAVGLVSVGCEKARAAETSVSVSDTKHTNSVQESNKQIVVDQVFTVASVQDEALLSNKAAPVTTSPAKMLTTICYEEEFAEAEFTYQYAIDLRRTKPPAFSGLGGDHFARADV